MAEINLALQSKMAWMLNVSTLILGSNAYGQNISEELNSCRLNDVSLPPNFGKDFWNLIQSLLNDIAF